MNHKVLSQLAALKLNIDLTGQDISDNRLDQAAKSLQNVSEACRLLATVIQSPMTTQAPPLSGQVPQPLSTR